MFQLSITWITQRFHINLINLCGLLIYAGLMVVRYPLNLGSVILSMYLNIPMFPNFKISLRLVKFLKMIKLLLLGKQILESKLNNISLVF